MQQNTGGGESMKRIALAGFVFLVLFGAGGLASEMPPRRASRRPLTRIELFNRLDRRITVTFDELELADALRHVAARAGLNIVIAPDVDREKRIDFRARDMRVEDVLYWLMELSGYRVRYHRQALYVTGLRPKNTQVRAYNIADLLRTPRDFHAPDWDGEEDDDGFVEETLEERQEKVIELIRRATGVEAQIYGELLIVGGEQD